MIISIFLINSTASVLSAFSNLAEPKFEPAYLKEGNLLQAECFMNQIKETAGESLGDLSRLETVSIFRDFFAESPQNQDKTKADIVYAIFPTTPSFASTRYVLRLSAIEGAIWNLGIVSGTNIFLHTMTAATSAELIDHSFVNGTNIKKFLFNVNLEKCRNLVELRN